MFVNCSACGGSVRPENGFYVCRGCGLCSGRHIINDRVPTQDQKTGQYYTNTTFLPTVSGQRAWNVRKRVKRVAYMLGMTCKHVYHAFNIVNRFIRVTPYRHGHVLGTIALIITGRHYGLPIKVNQFIQVQRSLGSGQLKGHFLNRLLEGNEDLRLLYVEAQYR